MSDSYSIEAADRLDVKISRMGPTYKKGKTGKLTPAWKPGDPPEVPFARGSGGLVTTAWDYAVFMQTLLNGGRYGGVRLLRPDTVRTMLSAHTPPGAGSYGYGWGINDGGVFTHSGSTGTYAFGGSGARACRRPRANRERKQFAPEADGDPESRGGGLEGQI